MYADRNKNAIAWGQVPVYGGDGGVVTNETMSAMLLPAAFTFAPLTNNVGEASFVTTHSTTNPAP